MLFSGSPCLPDDAAASKAVPLSEPYHDYRQHFAAIHRYRRPAV
jgi:hypothetical protein